MRTGAIQLVAAVLAGLALLGCRRDSAEPPPVEKKKPAVPNVIFLTVDTLRADHLGAYGYDRPTMPWLDEFAAEATVFENAVVPRGSTRSSYASMLTGLYPHRHGARHNRLVLHDDTVTLAEVLKSAGYHTAGFVSNFILISELSGCDQGFDVYDDRLTDKESYRDNFERTADRTADAILAWLADDPPQPFFLFTNFIDPHGPYQPPEAYRAQFRSGKTKPMDPAQIPDYQAKAGEPADFHDFVDRYDAEIRFTNDAIKRVVDALKATGVWDNAIVVFTADHGESLGMHGIYFEHHFHVWEETTRVPLAIKLPGEWPTKGKRIGDVASPMDLPATVLSRQGPLAVIKLPPDMDGIDLTDLLKGTDQPDRLVFMEFPSMATPAREPFPDVWGARSATHKLIMVTDVENGRPLQKVLYNVQNDPNEQSPLAMGPSSPVWTRLNRELLDHVMSVRSFSLPFVVTEYEVPMKDRTDYVKKHNDRVQTKPLTKEQTDKLRGLGYVD